MEQNIRAELQQRDVDISRLEGQLARCQIQQNRADLATATVSQTEPLSDQTVSAPQVNKISVLMLIIIVETV